MYMQYYNDRFLTKNLIFYLCMNIYVSQTCKIHLNGGTYYTLTVFFVKE